MIPSSSPNWLRTWIPISLGLHALLLALLGCVSFPAPSPGDTTSVVPVRVVEEPAPEPPHVAPRPAPRPKATVVPPKPAPKPPQPAPRPKATVVPPRPAPRVSRPAPRPRAAVVPPRHIAHPTPSTVARAGHPGGTPGGMAQTPGGGLHRGAGRTNPAPPAVMRAPHGRGPAAPPGRPGGTGTRGTGAQAGGGAEPAGPTTGPVSLGGPVPSYPKMAEEAGDEGSVVVTVSISAGGEVESASVSSSSGHSSLDAAALRAARSWKFRPALHAGKPVSSTRSLRFHFANGSVTGE